ncbi:hypothetical protein [Sphingomonas sp.]|uniref:hypothetical protein n=1 Tax=Sphingomonas sp. TaxID=28214 RepID=UPI002FD8DD42
MSDSDDIQIEIWKTIIDVQKHFNELEMRVRNVAVTVLAAFLAAAGFTMKENMHVALDGTRISLTSLVLAGGALCWLAFYGMDRFWYHRLLIGAVRQGMIAEDALADRYPAIRLTKAIGDASPIEIGSFRVHSSRKIDIFYLLIAGLLGLAAVVSLLQSSRPVASGDITGQRRAASLPTHDARKSSVAAPTRTEKADTPAETLPQVANRH